MTLSTSQLIYNLQWYWPPNPEQSIQNTKKQDKALDKQTDPSKEKNRQNKKPEAKPKFEPTGPSIPTKTAHMCELF